MFYFCLLWQSWGCFKVRFPGDHCGTLPLRWESNLQMQNVQKRICKPEKTKPVCALFTAQGGKIFSANVLTFCGTTWAYKHSPLLCFIASVSINFPASLTHIKVSVALMWQLNREAEIMQNFLKYIVLSQLDICILPRVMVICDWRR